MPNHVELSTRAEPDVRRLGKGPERERFVNALEQALTAAPPPDNLDITALAGAAPWLRLRVGPYRILFRALSAGELVSLRQRRGTLDGPSGYLVERIVHRRELLQAVASLP